MDDGDRAFGLGFVVGLILALFLTVIAFSHFHDEFCLSRYTTIDGKCYYWGHDPKEDSGRSYYWQSVKVVPKTTFTPVEEDTCGGK